MKKVLAWTYAGIAYALAMANIVYIVGFLADFGVPKGINTGHYDGSLTSAVVVNLLLVTGFGLHHSVTARPFFKRWWTRFVPAHLERATYLYMTAVVTAILVVAWQPIPITVWHVDNVWAAGAIIGAFLLTIGMMFSATFHFGHFGFFGLSQVWRWVREARPAEPVFAARYLYALIRHPISLGWMVLPWLTPRMTVGQLVFAVSVTLYVLIATYFEEADLVSELGERYQRYRKEVPAFLPFLRGRASAGLGRQALCISAVIGLMFLLALPPLH
ncbi:methyltransferase family protein [Saccharospirillum salsuginis]|uniref:Membrane protein n=1 Tax=Saccharospirillum salsuginis TaxID=418750 RepID=A0A918KPS8_9GAMM|nr:isoprenylcysteine carboxylmethyltransferase family protein [Saccharospirillum salsuginis]GGX68757.1 membrane protein [Saccharospirillum salsuginis]